MGKKNRKKILVVTYWDFNEAHVQANVLPNLRILHEVSGAAIFLFCLNKKPLSKTAEAAVQKELRTDGIRLIWFHYSHFGARMMLKFLWLIPFLVYTVFRNRIGRIYAWCTTAGAIGYIVSVLTGRALVLESYEPHAEAMVENGYWTRKRFPYKVLSWFEKKQAQRAAYIIAANKGMDEYVYRRYGYRIPSRKFFTKPACVDLQQFNPDPSTRSRVREELGIQADHTVCLYSGKFGGIYLEDETFHILKAGYDTWGDAFRILLLTSQDRDYLRQKAEAAGLPFDIFIVRFVPHREVPAIMQAADFALTPVKPVPTKKYCTPVKDGEYWALGLPVVITAGISDDSDIIVEHEIGAVIRKLTPDEYAGAMQQIARLLNTDRSSLAARIRFVAGKYRNYEIAWSIYRQIEGNIPKDRNND
jgi:glycosyltransferase involved in cell wall biosynthesis